MSTNILDAIGGTSLVQLAKLAQPGGAAIFMKAEWENPTGSMKDRMARAVILDAEARGLLKPGGTVVEYTGGSTGTSLALVCAARGYRLKIVTSDAFSQEKRDQMAALGAELTLVPSEGGRSTAKLFIGMVETATRISQEPGTFFVNQMRNHVSETGYHALAEEALEQMGGRIDAFVHGVGSSSSLHGISSVLRRRNPGVHIVAAEPAESSVLQGGPTGPHQIEGVGIGFMPPLWTASLADEVMSVSSEEAKAMARRLAREEGVFAGTSSGMNVVAALRLADRLGAGARILTLGVDSGLKYLSTEVYRSIGRP